MANRRSERRVGRRILKAAIIIVGVLLGGVFLVSRIDRSEPLTAEQMVLKPGAVELTADTNFDWHVYADYLKTNAQSPVDYVVEKFRTHDVVLLGEAHQIREDCELIEQLIEPVYRRAGVKTLSMEIIKQGRTDEINRIVTALAYDSARVVQIFREDYFYWGFQEYLDIIRSVWAFNRTLGKGAQPFRVIGFQPDMDIYAVDCGSLPRKVLQFPRLLRMEELYAKPILKQVKEKNEKVLVQVGYFHTFQTYRQPKVIDGKMYGEMARVRMGNLLRAKLGDRVFQISLHVRHDGWEAKYEEKPTTTVMRLFEKLYAENGSAPIGFDIVKTPFAMLRDTSSFFFAYQKHVTMEDIAQGYILKKPFEELHPVKWVDGFVTAENFKKLRTYVLQRHLMKESDGISPEALQATLTAMKATGVRFP